MTQMLHLDERKKRMAALVLVRSQTRPNYRPEMILALQHVFAAGPVSRGEFVQLTGLKESTGRKALKQLQDDGLLRSETPKGEVSNGLPLDALDIPFPNLYPEAATRVLEQ